MKGGAFWSRNLNNSNKDKEMNKTTKNTSTTTKVTFPVPVPEEAIPDRVPSKHNNINMDSADENHNNINYYFLVASTRGNESAKTLIGNPIPISKSVAQLFISPNQAADSAACSLKFPSQSLSQWNMDNVNGKAFQENQNQNETPVHGTFGPLMEVLFNPQRPQEPSTFAMAVPSAPSNKNICTSTANNRNNNRNRKTGNGITIRENLLTIKSLPNTALQAFLPFKSTDSKIAQFKSSRGRLRLDTHAITTRSGNKKAPADEMQEDARSVKEKHHRAENFASSFVSEEESQLETDNEEDSLTESESEEMSYGVYPEQSESGGSGVSSGKEDDSEKSDDERNDRDRDHDREDGEPEKKNDGYILDKKKSDDGDGQDEDIYVSASESMFDAHEHGFGSNWNGFRVGIGIDMEDEETLAKLLDLSRSEDYFKNLMNQNVEIVAEPMSPPSSSCSRTSALSTRILNANFETDRRSTVSKNCFSRKSGSGKVSACPSAASVCSNHRCSRQSSRSCFTGAAIPSTSRISMASSSKRQKPAQR